MTTLSASHDAASDAWLRAIAAHGWRDAAIDQAAAESGMSAEALISLVGDKFDAVTALQDRVFAETAKGAAGTGSARERLFDGLMRGFDALQAHRAAVLTLWDSRDPGLAALLLGRARAGFRRLAGAAGISVDGLRGEARLAALAAIVAKAFAAWRTDDSADMAATMAELDRLLERAERAETEGVSPELLGLPGLGSLFDRLPGFGAISDRLPGSGRRSGRDDQAPRSSPGPSEGSGPTGQPRSR